MAPPLRLIPGTSFAGDFEIVAPIAEGGMGAVYRVRTRAGSELALKVLHPELVADETVRRRFAQEAHLTDQLESPHVVRVLRTGIDAATGVPFLAMELLNGPTLREQVDRKGPFDPTEAREILGQLTSALAEAHRRGMIHRDLKPENIVLHEERGARVVKLLDFGVAKVIDLNRTSGTGTAPVGSPLWMAPEQTSAGNRISPATDVWALGLIAFWMLTGQVYWRSVKGGGVTGLMREMHLDPIERASVRAALVAPGIRLPAGFDDWFARAAARNAMERYQDAGEAMAALRPILTSSQRIADHSDIAYASTMAFPVAEVKAALEASAPRPAVVTAPETSGLRPAAAEPSGLRPAAAEPSGPAQPAPPPAHPPAHAPAIPTTDPPPAMASAPRSGLGLGAWIAIVLALGVFLMIASATAMWILLHLLHGGADIGSASILAHQLAIASWAPPR